MEKKILACVNHTGSVNATKSVIRELKSRGHSVEVYATGNEAQAKNLEEIPYIYAPQLSQEDCNSLLNKNYQLVLVGLSSVNTPEYFFLKSASRKGTASVVVPDLDIDYPGRLGHNPDFFPTILSIMNENCRNTIRNEYQNNSVAEELIKRTKVTGWTFFEPLASLRENFSETDKKTLLTKLDLDPEQPHPVHFTQNIHPDTEYMKPVLRPYEAKLKSFNHELETTEKIFEIASGLGTNLIVKPHPGEQYKENFTLDLVNKFDFVYVPAKACDTKQLMLSAASVSGGRTTCLDEGCLLGVNIAGLFPGLSAKDVTEFNSIKNKAIPYTFGEEEGIETIFMLINSKDKWINEKLAEKRKKFSVDGKASKTLVDIIEEEIF